jgi:stringent starvation protein B
VWVDATVWGVRVPPHLMSNRNLVLNYSYNYHISDFNFDDTEIVASLSFQGRPYRCVIPWSAVLGIGNNGDSVYYDFSGAVSPEEQKEPEKGRASLRKIDGLSEAPEVQREKPKLVLIKGGKE